MVMEDSDLHQKAVLCSVAGRDNYGKVTRNAAVEINVRWEEKRAEQLNAEGVVIAVDAVVIVDRDISIGSILWLGALADFSSSSASLKQVISFKKIPDIKNRAHRRRVEVMKYSDALPALA